MTDSFSVDEVYNHIVRLGSDSGSFSILMSDCVHLGLLEQGCGGGRRDMATLMPSSALA